MSRIGLPLPRNEYYDVYDDAKYASIDVPNRRLKTMCEYYGRVSNAHDALDECISTDFVMRSISPNMFRHIVVAQLDSEGAVISTFEDAASAAQALGCDKARISACLSGRQKTAFKFGWKFLDITDQKMNNS